MFLYYLNSAEIILSAVNFFIQLIRNNMLYVLGVCWSVSGKLLSLNISLPNPVALSSNVS